MSEFPARHALCDCVRVRGERYDGERLASAITDQLNAHLDALECTLGAGYVLESQLITPLPGPDLAVLVTTTGRRGMPAPSVRHTRTTRREDDAPPPAPQLVPLGPTGPLLPRRATTVMMGS